MGTNTSTRKLSEELDIHDRTIRYRLSRLRKEGYLHPPTIQSHERKLGLGEYTIFVTSVPGKEQTLEKIFNDAQSIYFYNPTTGRYEGYVIYASYPLSNPTLVPNMVKELIKRGLIEDYHLHDVLDYKRRGCVIKRVFLGPPVDWAKWIKSIPRVMKRKRGLQLELDDNPTPVECDAIDVGILGLKVDNPEITLKELGKQLSMSQPQIHSRLKKLEDSGVIRGYKPSISPFKNSIKMGIVFKSKEYADKIIMSLYQLPYFIAINMASKSHYYIIVEVPSSELNSFLKGIKQYRPYTENMFVQFMEKGIGKGFDHVMSAFNPDSQEWEFNLDEFIDVLNKHST